MDCELVQLAGVPVGLVTSALFYATDNASSRQAELEDPSEQAKEVRIGICPTGRLIAFLASFKAQFVACSESLHVRGGATSVAAYKTSYEGLLKVVRDPNKPRPIATAVVVVPITLETKKDPSSIILVGFSDGYIRAYSKMGNALFSQLLHGEPVVTIHCMAPNGDHRRPSKNNMSVLVVFASSVCVLEGRSLCEAVGHAVATRDQWADNEEVPLISCQKWRLGDLRDIADAALLAPSVPTLYDYLCEAGNVGGYDTAVKGGPTPQSRLIVVGDSPMVALYKISRDSGTVNVSEVVSAVASKMTRSVLGKLSQAGGWLGWRGGSTPPSRPKPQEKKMVMNLPMSTNIPDERRTVNSISVSPIGDLSVCVDGFGRVLLLDNHAMTIRRMWKGYRDAQTGWILVHDTSQQPAIARGRRRTAGKTTSSSRGTSTEDQRRAQCLCIYLPRRGIVELWPVQKGDRVAVFPVGKGCRLLTAPHEVFTAAEQEQGASDSGWGRGCGLQHTPALLCPNGQLLSFLVPFPTLVRLNDSSSHDTHLLQKLSPALQAGDSEVLLQITLTVRTAESLKEAVERVMYACPLSNLPRQFPYTLLNSSLMRTSHSDPTHRALRGYLGAVRQLLYLYSGLNQIPPDRHLPPSSVPPPSELAQMLTELCGLAERQASEMADSLQRYASCKPAKLHTHVMRTLTLKELMRCFDLATKVGRVELSQEVGVTSSTAEPQQKMETVPLVLKRGLSNSAMFDLGFALFHLFLTQDVAEKTLQVIFSGCGIPSSTLLTLLCRVFLSGRVVESNPCQLLLRLHKIVQTITPEGGMEGEAEAVADIRSQCSHTHNVGHALLFALLCQKLVTPHGEESERVMEEEGGWGEGDWGSGEGWDTVTEEGEQWVRLLHRLEVLTYLCGAVGLSVMSKIPPLPFLRLPRENLSVQLMNRGGCVSKLLLEAVGPWLVPHCVANWLVGGAVPPQFIATIPCDPADAQDSEHRKVVSQLAPVLRLFRHSLSHCSLLVHCAWQAAYLWRKEPTKHQKLHQYVLQCISLIPDPQLLAGMILFLWHSLFEAALVDILDCLKRGTQQTPGALELISLSRLLFAYLYQLREVGREGSVGEKMVAEGERSLPRDMLSIPVPSDKQFLMDIIPNLTIPSPSLIQTYLALLLHTELALLLGSSHNVTSFYPTWVRMALKRELLGISRDSRQDQSLVATQLQLKRTKFLCDCVTCFLDSPAPKLRLSTPSIAVRTLPSPAAPSSNLEVAEFTNALFLLGELWGVEVDTVHRHFVSCLFAASLGNRGKEAFQCVRDKSHAALDLLSLAGCLTDTLIQQIASKPERLALTAQVPPTQLEWIRKQSSSSVTKSCPKMSPTWTSLSQLISLVQPHLPPSSQSSVAIAHSLAKIISLQTL